MAGYNPFSPIRMHPSSQGPMPEPNHWRQRTATVLACACGFFLSSSISPTKKTPMSLETTWGNKQVLFSSILLGEKTIKRRERFTWTLHSSPLSVIPFWGAISVTWLWMWWTVPPPEATPSRWRSSNAIHPWLHIAVSAIPESRPWRAPPWPTSAPRATQLTTAVTCRTSAGHCRVALQ